VTGSHRCFGAGQVRGKIVIATREIRLA